MQSSRSRILWQPVQAVLERVFALAALIPIKQYSYLRWLSVRAVHKSLKPISDMVLNWLKPKYALLCGHWSQMKWFIWKPSRDLHWPDKLLFLIKRFFEHLPLKIIISCATDQSSITQPLRHTKCKPCKPSTRTRTSASTRTTSKWVDKSVDKSLIKDNTKSFVDCEVHSCYLGHQVIAKLRCACLPLALSRCPIHAAAFIYVTMHLHGKIYAAYAIAFTQQHSL